MKKYILLFLFNVLICFFYTSLFAQQIIRQSIGSIGSVYSENGFLLRQTIGQPSNTEIFTSDDNYTLRQGFQQPLSSVSVRAISTPCLSSIYPNPARDYFMFDGIDASNQSYIELIDMYGKNVLSEKISESTSKQIFIQHLPAGMYLISYSNNNGSMCYSKLVIN